MGLFGKRKTLNIHSECYCENEKEITVLTLSTPSKQLLGEEKAMLCSMPLIGCIDGDKLSISPVSLQWYCKAGRNANPFKLKKECAYTLRVRPSCATNENGKPVAEGRNLLVTGIISRKVKDARIDALLEAYKKEVTLTLCDGSVLTLDKKTGEYTGEISAFDTDCLGITIDSCGGKQQFEKNVTYVNLILALGERWLNVAKDYICNNMFDNASEWCDDDLTAEQFKNRISLTGIYVYDDGTYWVFFDDDDIFLGHWIVIRGEIGKGFNEVTLMG